MFNPHVFENSSPAGAAYMEVVQPIQHDRDRDVAPPQPIFMPLKRTNLSGVVTGPLARLTIDHEFVHPDEQDGPVLEAVYRFPLPGDAAVTGVRARFGEVELRAELAERSFAERDYDAARQSGHQAMLVTRESPDVFSMHVSGIEPGQSVHVQTEFVQLARAESAGFSLRVPLTPAPRYVSFAGLDGRHAHGQPIALTDDPGHRFALDIEVRGASDVTSPTHSLRVAQSDDALAVKLSDGEVVPDRDLLIEWQPPTGSNTPALQVLTYREPAPDEPEATRYDYFLATISPPRTLPSDTNHAREIVLLVDRSGSMSGPKWQAAEWALRQFLLSLKPYDCFSVGLFHSDTHWFSRASLHATRENVAAAFRFIDEHQDSGGTELETALEEALTCGRDPDDRARHIVIITDAQVSNAARVLELARSEQARPDRRRISVLCIDSAPNAHLVYELVAIGGGRASFLTSDPEESDITTALESVLAWWNEPAEIGLSMTVNQPDVWVMGRQIEESDGNDTEITRIDLGDLPAGRSTWIVGRMPASEEPAEFSLERSDGERVAAGASPAAGDAAIKALFGSRRLLALEYQLESLSSWRFARHRIDTHDGIDNLRRLLVSESLCFGLACSETAFVAVRQEAGKLVERGAIVPNAMPFGWEMPRASRSVLLHAPPEKSRVMRSMNLDDDVLEAREELLDDLSPAFSQIDKRDRIKLFEGVPPRSEGSVVLYEAERLGADGFIEAICVTVIAREGTEFDGRLDLYVRDDVRPRATMRLSDVLGQGGRRPAHLFVRSRYRVRLVLRDVTGTPAEMTVELEIRGRSG